MKMPRSRTVVEGLTVSDLIQQQMSGCHAAISKNNIEPLVSSGCCEITRAVFELLHGHRSALFRRGSMFRFVNDAERRNEMHH